MHFIHYFLLLFLVIVFNSSCGLKEGDNLKSDSPHLQLLHHMHSGSLDSAMIFMVNGEETKHVDSLKTSLQNFRKGIYKMLDDTTDLSFRTNSVAIKNEDSGGVVKLAIVIAESATQKVKIAAYLDVESDKVLALKTTSRVVSTEFTIFSGVLVVVGLLALIVLMFNILALIIVYRSRPPFKLPYYLLIVLLNVPGIKFKLAGSTVSWSLKILGIHLMGAGLVYNSFYGTMISVSLPLGALIALNMLRNKGYLWFQKPPEEDTATSIE